MRTVLLLLAAQLTVLDMAFAACDVPPASAKRFVRHHKVYHFNGDPPSEVSDQLLLWPERKGNYCFALTTTGPNYHECEVTGSAFAAKGHILAFKEGSCMLTFKRTTASVELLASPGWERIGRGGVCTAQRCGMFGEVESGVFKAR